MQITNGQLARRAKTSSPPTVRGPFVIRHSSFARAFTLIEIMVVVAIMAIILAAGVPSLYSFFHKEGIRKSMNDILETCQSTRAKAITTGSPAELVIHPKDGTFEVGGGSDGGHGAWAHSAKVEGGRIEALKINNGKEDCSQFETVTVRFFPNGTSEEMILILMSTQGEMRGITLELTTGMAIPLSDAAVRSSFGR